MIATKKFLLSSDLVTFVKILQKFYRDQKIPKNDRDKKNFSCLLTRSPL
jgi:hypothetical protein